MLYDKKWDKKLKTDPHTLSSLIAWLEQQPPQGRYEYGQCWYCLLAKYYTAALGVQDIEIEPETISYGMVTRKLPEHFDDIAYQAPHTFGAALKRARALATD